MAEVKIKTTEAVTEFVASDGTRFSNKEKAQKYEDFITARDEFVYARRRFRNQIAEQFVTKDGYQFTVDGLWNTDFYRIIEDYHGYPSVEKIESWSLRADFEIHVDEYDDDKLRLKIAFLQETTCGQCTRYGKIWKSYDPSTLYKQHANALKDLALRLEEHAVQIREYAGTVRTKVLA